MEPKDTPVVNTEASAATAETSSEQATSKKEVPLENRLGELTRKMNKFLDLEKKVDLLVNYVNGLQPSNSSYPSSASYNSGYSDVDSKIDQKLVELKRFEAFNEAKKIYPQLDKNSDQFDERFYEAVDKEYLRFNQFDIEAPLTAAQIVAQRMGLTAKQIKEQVLLDDNRRTRVLAEGGAVDNKPSKADTASLSSMNEQRLSKYLGVNPEKLKQRIKSNPDRYGVKK